MSQNFIKIQRVTGTCNQFSGKIFLTSRNIKKGIKKTEHIKKQLNLWTNFEENEMHHNHGF